MDLPVPPPVKPMLAKAVEAFPSGDLSFEPKWDGFRCIVFRDGHEIELGSRNERPLTRYFPELVEQLRAALPPRIVVDGEIIVVSGDRLDFDALQQRIHPAVSRINRLAAETPALFVAFDLLCLGERDLRQEPFSTRRALLEEAVAVAAPGLHRCPATEDPELARRWYHEFEGAGLDGLIAKPRAGRYEPDKRVQFKIKHRRSVDCVVAGYRTHKDGAGVGSMLLGLYDSAGVLHHLGVTASFSAKLRTQLAQDLAPLAEGALDDHPWAEWARPEAHEATRLPGAMSRWNGAKDLSWVPVRIERVVEVEYLTVTNGRFRGVTTFKRWRDDRDPVSCRFDQLVEVDPVGVSHVLQPTT